ncbi:stalk domain-containing protein [Paenibacillus radicis (ex Xue et al. 2023)]|uniref:Copper amine oxidase-like N-terminal domain-containing protein n=1 Tax=Paenibacillus radicis (ex Xue et al. 2023) TaxID=2972489 RepID=A0ABT1YGV1_9BACL|nr:hypothetical protein [Paenibacillus radicis (ex Xue et al. 2023)]MCR8631955.1 hypothetical protein [Paenibacillus radicis (ex Xue et al. 2023)]
MINVPKLLIVMMLVFSLISPMSALADKSNYTVYINNKKLDSEHSPFVENNIIYVPLWSVLGHLNMSAEDYEGVLRINHPYRILLIKADQNLMTYFGTSMEVNSVRLDYPVVSKDYVLYAPLVFLQDYVDMQIAYGEDGRIDIIAGDYSKGVSWANTYGKKLTIERSAKQLKLDANAEEFWSKNPVLWSSSSSIGYNSFDEKYTMQTVVSYSGAKVTLVNTEKEYTINFDSMETIKRTFLTYDPLSSFTWNESIKSTIRQGYVKIGMTKEMATLAWGSPDDINKYSSKYSYNEQWVYRGSNYNNSYLYFDETGKVTSIQN